MTKEEQMKLLDRVIADRGEFLSCLNQVLILVDYKADPATIKKTILASINKTSKSFTDPKPDKEKKTQQKQAPEINLDKS